MKVVPDFGPEIDLGTLEASPTIGMIDYSRRVTDDFGVTTVIKRGFSRRMSVRLAMPFDQVDAVQASLADLRATSAVWEADPAYDWLNFEGFYKDFELDLAVPPISFCTLTVEGLVETEAGVDDGSDPAPDGGASTLRVLQPVTINDATLLASNVTEIDYPEWIVGTNYALASRVIKASTHRIYESAASGNLGNDPANSPLWIDIGPTNRWAMFDQALGSVTTRNSNITLTIAPGNVDAIALLDVIASTVRVQATGYDETVNPTNGSASFLDLPGAGGNIVVTITGTGTVSVGTLLAGDLAKLGVTGEAPTAAITDFSRKETDDFGDVTVVERAWSKRMSARSIIETAAIDVVANRIASLRATPALWIGDDGTESLSIYGFFKEFSIEVGENVSMLSLSVEGLSKAAPVNPAASIEELIAAARRAVNFIQDTEPSAEESFADDIWLKTSTGMLYRRVPDGGIWLGGYTVTLGGNRPVIRWTQLNQQPLVDVIIVADNSLAIAAAATSRLASIDDDDVLDRSEKISNLKPNDAALETAYTALIVSATARGVSTAAATVARANYLAFRNAIAPAWDDINTDSPITRGTFDTVILAYRSALEALEAAVKGAIAGTADSALGFANIALEEIGKIADDDWLTSGEKTQADVIYKALIENNTALQAKAVARSIAATERAVATTAIGTLTTYLASLVPAWTDLTTDSPMTGSLFRSYFQIAHEKVALLQAAIQGALGDRSVAIYKLQYAPPSTPTGDSPAGWSESPASGTATRWKSTGRKNEAGQLVGVWSAPVEDAQGAAQAYSAGITFYVRNLCLFNGGTYIALQVSTTGNAPTGTDQANAYWGVIAAPGNTGAPATPPSAFSATINLTSSGGSNLRTIANANGYTGASDATITFNVPNGVTIRGASGGGIGIDSGTWPSSSYAIALTIVVQSGGIVDGGGGDGGAGGGGSGSDGGDAFYIRTPISGGVTIDAGGTVRGGGGGGNGGPGEIATPPGAPLNFDDPYNGGGGGGGGRPNGIGGEGELGDNGGTSGGNGADGTTTTTGAGGAPNGGGGGGFATSAGGAAGYAVRKNGNAVTVTNSGTMTGTAA